MRLLLIIMVGLAGCNQLDPCREESEPTQTATTLQRLSLAQVEEQLKVNDGRVTLYDANPREIYDKHHLPTAQWVPEQGVTAELLPADKARELIFYCAETRCLSSHDAAEKALALGWTHVSIMPEGIFGWVKAGLPTESN